MVQRNCANGVLTNKPESIALAKVSHFQLLWIRGASRDLRKEVPPLPLFPFPLEVGRLKPVRGLAPLSSPSIIESFALSTIVNQGRILKFSYAGGSLHFSTSPLPLEVGPVKPASGSGRALKSAPVGSEYHVLRVWRDELAMMWP